MYIFFKIWWQSLRFSGSMSIKCSRFIWNSYLELCHHFFWKYYLKSLKFYFEAQYEVEKLKWRRLTTCQCQIFLKGIHCCLKIVFSLIYRYFFSSISASTHFSKQWEKLAWETYFCDDHVGIS